LIKNLVTTCPRCNGKLTITRIGCNNCGLEIKGDFPFSKFDYLSKDELYIIECFLKAQGNFKTVQQELVISYPLLKKRYNEILKKLNLPNIKGTQKDKKNMLTATSQPINETDSLIVKKIKEKLNESGGKAIIPLLNGGSCDIGFDKNGKGLITSKLPKEQSVWEAFDAAVEVVLKNNGRIIKGNARNGKLGSDHLPIDSLEGYIAHKVHGVQIGGSALGPGFVIAAVLDWAEICHNERGYIKINNKFLEEYKK
jgi:hypothetical protein